MDPWADGRAVYPERSTGIEYDGFDVVIGYKGRNI